MDKQELIRINLQLPASALDSLSRLAEQLRLLTTATGGRLEVPPRQVSEEGESAFFDPSQFQSLQLKAESMEARCASPSEQAAAAMTRTQAAVPVRAEVAEAVRTPESAGCKASEYGKDHSLESSSASSTTPGSAAAASGVLPEYAVQPEQRGPAEEPEDIPAVRPAMGGFSDSPAVQPEAEDQAPEPDVARVETIAPDALLPPIQAKKAAQTETASPPGAGMVITAGPDAPQSRWNEITEELVVSGPAPLTAESVSLAFQRDGRRYDNGFPLY